MGQFFRRGILRIRPKNKLAQQAYRANEVAISAAFYRERYEANTPHAAFHCCGEGLTAPSSSPPNARPSP